MNFQAKNLDEAYAQIKKISDLSTTEGDSLSHNLALNIASLKSHWIGSDAASHINNLILVYKAMCAIVTDVSTLANEVSKPIVTAQTIRNSNGGRGDVGQIIASKVVSPSIMETLSDTQEYFVDPAAKDDYGNLTYISENFVKFKDKFMSMKNELLENWISGSERPKALSIFNEFENSSSKYNKMLMDSRDNLGIAVSNMSKL